jgi:hypothetical protein
VSNLELGEVAGTDEVTLAEGEARAGLSTAAFEANVALVVGDEGQFAQGLGEEDGTVFTIAVVEGVGSLNLTAQEIVDGLVEGPSTADSVESTIRSKITSLRWTGIETVTSD